MSRCLHHYCSAHTTLVVLAFPVVLLACSTACGQSDSPRSNPWRQELAGGGTIELIGIGAFPSQVTKQWWSPRGNRLETPPYDFIRASFFKLRGPLRRCEFAFRVSGKPLSQPLLHCEGEVARGGLASPQHGDSQPPNLLAASVTFRETADVTSIQLQVGKGDHQQTITFANVPLRPKAQRRGQQEAGPPRYAIQDIDKSMRNHPAWIDLKQRLESSDLKYRSVSVKADGTIRLSFSACGTPSLEPLRGAKITSLALNDTGVSDLTPLAGMPLSRLVLSGSQVTDLTPLSGMPLEYLSIHGTSTTDLTPIAGAKLKTLSAAYSNVRDLTPLANQPITYLDLRRTRVADLSPLAGLPLESLQIDETPVHDLTPLQKLPLQTLFVTWKDGMSLGQLNGSPLTWLKISGRKFNGLAAIENVKKLERLYLHETSVEDLTLLRGLPLREVSLNQTPVVDLSPLSDSQLRDLYVTEPGVDLAPLEHVRLKSIAIPAPKACKNLDVLRSIETLETIRPPSSKPIPVQEFWEQLDKLNGTKKS